MNANKLVSFDRRIGRGLYGSIALPTGIVGAVAWSLAAGEYGALVTLLAMTVGTAAMLVSLATNVKRWHDRDKSGWWYFIALIPIIGTLWTLIELGFLAGTDGANQYGAPGSGSPFASEALATA